MEADKIISSVKAGESTETLLSLLDQIDYVGGLYFDLAEFELDKTFLDALFRKTRDVREYLEVALEHNHVTDYLISRSTDFRGCFSKMLRYNYSYEEILTVLENSNDVDGCLTDMVKSGCYYDFIEFALDTIISKTTDFEGCLYIVLQEEYPSKKIAKALVERTINFDGCLCLAMQGSDIYLDIVEKLIEKGATYPGCMHDALDNIFDSYDRNEVVDMLIDADDDDIDFDGCLLKAIDCRIDTELIFLLIEKTTDLDGSLRDVMQKDYIPNWIVKRLVEKGATYPNFLHDVLDKIYDEHDQNEVIGMIIKNGVDVDGFLLRAINHDVEAELISLLIEKTTDFDDCLGAAIYLLPNHPEILEALIDKTEDTSEELEIALRCYALSTREVLEAEFRKEFGETNDLVEIDYEIIYKLLTKAENVSNACLFHALNSYRVYPEKFLLELFYKTKDPSVALSAAIGNENTPPEMLEAIFTKATNFGGCLAAALGNKRANPELIERLLTETSTNFTGCLESTLKNGNHPLELYERLLSLTPVIESIHVIRALKGRFSQEFVEKLLARVDDAGASLGVAILREYPVDLLYKIYEKTTNFTDCIWYITRSNTTTVPLDLITKIFGWVDCDVEDLYEKGTHSLEFMRVVLKQRGSVSQDCILRVIERSVYPIEFVDEMMGVLRHGGMNAVGELVRLGCSVDFIERHIDKYSDVDGLDKVLKRSGGGFSTDFLMKLVKVSSNLDGALASAIEGRYPTELLDSLLEKGGRIDRVESPGEAPLPPEYKKYYNIFRNNAECFICLLDFEEGDITKELPCKHKVHSACVEDRKLDFKCPYH